MTQQNRGRVSSDDFRENQTALVAPDRDDDDLDLDNPPPMMFSTDTSDDDFDLGFVRLKILQRTTPEVEEGDGRSGEVYLEGIGVLESPVDLVPIGRNQSRIMKEDKRRINSDIVCRSPDAKRGFGDPGGNCSTCPFSSGTKEDTPDCTHIITYVMYVPAEDAIALISFQRTHLRAARRINTILRGKQMGEVAIQLTTRQTGDAPETYYVPVVKRIDVNEEWEIPSLDASQDDADTC